MSEKKPESKLVTIAKMLGVCIVCFGLIYGIVTLVTALTS